MTKSEVKEIITNLMGAGSCCQELKDACKAYLDADGTDNEKACAQALIDELKEDVTSLDGLFAFLNGPAPQILGEEAVKGMLKAAEAAKAAGEKTCICDACQLGQKILDNADAIL